MKELAREEAKRDREREIAKRRAMTPKEPKNGFGENKQCINLIKRCQSWMDGDVLKCKIL